MTERRPVRATCPPDPPGAGGASAAARESSRPVALAPACGRRGIRYGAVLARLCDKPSGAGSLIGSACVPYS
jgi:hypothetical protein